MLQLLGVQGHPGLRILIGAALIGLGVARHGAIPALVIGGVLVVWGVAAVLGLTGNKRGETRSGERRSR